MTVTKDNGEEVAVFESADECIAVMPAMARILGVRLKAQTEKINTPLPRGLACFQVNPNVNEFRTV